jgi:hypothetical protein
MSCYADCTQRKTFQTRQKNVFFLFFFFHSYKPGIENYDTSYSIDITKPPHFIWGSHTHPPWAQQENASPRNLLLGFWQVSLQVIPEIIAAVVKERTNLFFPCHCCSNHVEKCLLGLKSVSLCVFIRKEVRKKVQFRNDRKTLFLRILMGRIIANYKSWKHNFFCLALFVPCD